MRISDWSSDVCSSDLSAEARAATLSHTASLAGSDAAADAFLKRLGIARLDSVPAFLEALKLLHTLGPLDGFAISSMSCSGGEASVMADAAEGRRVTYSALPAGQASAGKAPLGQLVPHGRGSGRERGGQHV